MNVTITIKAIEENGEIFLYLEDTEGNKGKRTITTIVKPGAKVIWKLAKDSNINKIIDIYKKEDSINVFGTLPHHDNDNMWMGIVADDAEGSEFYNIKYEYKDGNVIVEDPEIEVKPPIN
ncbi:hypothetical protein E9993_14365 [Labilibacter sediminis]|nr:hypothetical protein E9993_14365 [Labilibacter sediminis]